MSDWFDRPNWAEDKNAWAEAIDEVFRLLKDEPLFKIKNERFHTNYFVQELKQLPFTAIQNGSLEIEAESDTLKIVDDDTERWWRIPMENIVKIDDYKDFARCIAATIPSKEATSL